jgi:hypothetical protein
VRWCLLLLICLATWSVPTWAAERDFAVGADEVLGYQPELPSGTSTAGTLKQILARPEFHADVAPPQGPSLLDRILQWFTRHLGGIGAGLAGASTVTLVITGALIAGLLVLLIYTVVKAIWWRMSRASIAANSAMAEELLGAASLKELARKAAAAGDYHAALRLRFKSVVGQLDLLDLEKQTNWQLLRYVRRSSPGATSDFATLIGLFEDSWYGGRLVGTEDFARAESLALAIEAAIAPREEAA